MKVIVLAGGKGTRLRSVLRDVPKPMADIGGTPFLELLLENLRLHGAGEFILCVSHLRHVIEGHFGRSYKGIALRYSVEEEPLGTGGAVKQAFGLYGLEEALVVNGDTFVQADYATFWEQGAKEELAVLLKHVADTGRFGAVEAGGGRILSFREKSAYGGPGLINAGVYRVKASLLAGMPRAFSFERDLLEARVRELRPRMFLAGDYFIDIGVPESYAQACRELKGVIARAPARRTLSTLRDAIALLPRHSGGKCPALFLDRDGVINVEKNYVHKIEDCEFIDGIFELCREAKARGCKLIVVTNQGGIAKGYYTEADYHTLMAHIGREFEKEACPLDDVFYCPFHEEGKGIYQKDSDDRKPRPGMILKAAEKHGIDLGHSLLIGDKESDIEAGRRAGVASCLFYKAR